MAARAPDVPVVLGPTDQLCGAALLRAMLLGYGVDVSIDTLSPRLDIDETGANIDAMEDTAVAYGLPAEQIMVPPDLMFSALEEHLPTIVVVGSAGQPLAFQLLWDLEADGTIEVLDCSRGRLLLPVEDVRRSLYVHQMEISGDPVGPWLRSADFARRLGRGLTSRGVAGPEAASLIDVAQRSEDWTAVALVDAAARGADRMGREPLEVIQTAQRQGAAAAGLVDEDWFIRPSAVHGQAVIRGAVLLRVQQ